MASEVLHLTVRIVISHASMTELTPKELVQEIKEVYSVLASFGGEVIATEARVPVTRRRKVPPVKMVEHPEAKEVLDEEKAPFEDQDYLEFMADREG